MERKIGDTFEFEGRKLQVKESASNGCDGCFFYMKCSSITMGLSGECEVDARDDGKDVVFVEVQAQPQKTEEIKERKVGEVFEYEGHKLKVVADTDGRKCPKCFFYSRDCSLIRDVTGYCLKEKRIDRKGVTFVEVKDEQPQEQAEQPKDEQSQLNLCEILKNCPEGTELWSDDYGIVRFDSIFIGADTPIRVTRPDEYYSRYTKEGWHCKEMPGSCLLWPSRDCRDWSKFTAPWLKKERFDPKTLKPFDKIIFKGHGMWFCGLFSHIHNSYACVGETYYKCVIPYNDDTKHLLGTKEEAPEFYKYWED